MFIVHKFTLFNVSIFVRHNDVSTSIWRQTDSVCVISKEGNTRFFLYQPKNRKSAKESQFPSFLIDIFDTSTSNTSYVTSLEQFETIKSRKRTSVSLPNTQYREDWFGFRINI